MHNRDTGHDEEYGPETRPGARQPQGQTRPAQGPTQEPQPRMPYERDESADSQQRQEPSAERMGKIGHGDLERGVVDTGKGPVLDEAYEKTRKTSPSPETKFRR